MYPHRYKRKATRLMGYHEFTDHLDQYDRAIDRALVTLLFFTGCRISEALALTREDFAKSGNTLLVTIRRLKKGKHKKGKRKGETRIVIDSQPIPYLPIYETLLRKEGKIFPFGRVRAWKIVKRGFPDHYPHYFRMNWITQTAQKLGGATAKQGVNISWWAMDHYQAQIDQRIVKDFWEEMIKK